jgi:hypothetical protein
VEETFEEFEQVNAINLRGGMFRRGDNVHLQGVGDCDVVEVMQPAGDMRQVEFSGRVSF